MDSMPFPYGKPRSPNLDPKTKEHMIDLVDALQDRITVLKMEVDYWKDQAAKLKKELDSKCS